MEFELIRWLKKKYPLPSRKGKGIGDDTALLRAHGATTLMSTDVIVDGVDFLSSKASPELIGRKALAVNLSDIAAMGGVPTFFTVALGLPRNTSQTWVKKFYQGLMKLAKSSDAHLAGGDFSRSPCFFASVTLLGKPAGKKIVFRSGARAGDIIGVTGTLGGSILGRHFRFDPRLKEGRFLADRASAMIDVSDGLVQDLEHVLTASRCSAEVDLDKIPVSKDARALGKGSKRKALLHALSDGEDFELLFTAPEQSRMILERSFKARFPGTSLSWIGRVKVKRQSAILWFSEGKKLSDFSLAKKGYEHF